MIGRAAPAALESLRSRLTPGQWWTVGLALALAVAMLVFGLPAGRIVSRVASGPEPAGASERPPAAPDPIFERTAGDRPAAPRGSGATTAPDAEPEPTNARAAPPPRGLGEPVTVPGTRVAAIVRPSGSSLPGRDEASIATLFLARNGVSATQFTLDRPEAEVCAKASADADIVVASEGLPAELKSCLHDAGIRVLSYDVRGGAISTARGIAASLVEADALPGRVGVVVAEDLADQMQTGISLIEARGIEVVAVEVLASDADPAQISFGVGRFAGSGVETTVFAVPVAQQSQWAGQQSVATPGMRYVVLDSADAIYTESYPASFDGARAYTTIAVPWRTREDGETPEQQVCREAYEAHASGGIISGRERVLVYLWCQHAALLRGILDGIGTGITLEDVLAARRYASPFTSELGSRSGSFGPTKEAALRWTASCSCWVSERGFEERTP